MAGIFCLLGVLGSGCGSGDARSSAASGPAAPIPPDRATLPQISLPDLSKISPSAQSQLREGHAALLAKMQAGVPDIELGTAYGELGKLLMAAGYRDVAEACFQNAERVAVSDARWPYYLGHLNYASGDSPKAAASFERALQLRPDDAVTLLWLGRADLDRGRYADAGRRFERALSLQPRSASALLGLGEVALAKQEYGRAVQYLEQALSIDAKAGVIHYSLGMAYRGLGDVVKAESHLRQRNSARVQLSDPLMDEIVTLLETAMAYEIRGREALEKGEWTAATEFFRKGVELAPDEPSLRHKLGTALAASGDTRGAIRQFEDVVRRWPTFAKGHYSLGIILAGSGRHREAADRFTAALKNDPSDVQARLQLAEALRADGRFEDSLRHYDQAAELDPRIADAHFGHAMALVRLNRYREARDRLSHAMQVFPDQPGFAHAAARLLAAAPDEDARDGQRALTILAKLLRERPATIAMAETMAMALAEVGQYGEAAKWQRGAIADALRSGVSGGAPRMAESLKLYEQGRPSRMAPGDERAFVGL
jgi:tetratricopeptide (TPR) repeat protein